MPVPDFIFASIEVGQTIPPLEHEIDRLMMVKYCASSEDYAGVHWDQEYMKGQGFPDVVTQGWLTFALMCQSVTNWIPPENPVRRHRHGQARRGRRAGAGSRPLVEGQQRPGDHHRHDDRRDGVGMRRKAP